MSEPQEIRFSELVGRRLVSEGEDVRSLWTPMAHEFDRNGPDAVKSWLDAERQGIEERLENLLSQVER